VNRVSAFVAGLIFAVGLVLGGMTQPDKVFYFLDVAGGRWDPSLAFVMGGALVVYHLAHRYSGRVASPYHTTRFFIPTRSDITPELIYGAALFGVGWALGGFCPGPAIVAAGSGMGEALLFVAAMAAGMALSRAWNVHKANRKGPTRIS